MNTKEKITISIRKELLQKLDEKIESGDFKNRSHIIENFVNEGLQGRQDIGAIIIAHEKKWDDGEYPLDIPKCLIQVDGKTLLEKQLQLIKQANIKKCVIAIGNKQKQVKNFLKNKFPSLDIVFCEFDDKDESQKVIAQSTAILKTKKTVVLLGDNYFYNFSLLDFIYYHNTGNQDLSIAVKVMDSPGKYGNITLEGNDIVGFVEKPILKEDISFIVNAGIYMFESDIIPETTENKKIEADFFPDFVTKGKAKAYFHNGKWFHIQDSQTLSLFI